MAPRAKLTNPEAVQAIVDQYFEEIRATKQIVILRSGAQQVYTQQATVIGLCNRLDIDKSTFYRYLDPDGHGSPPSSSARSSSSSPSSKREEKREPTEGDEESVSPVSECVSLCVVSPDSFVDPAEAAKANYDAIRDILTRAEAMIEELLLQNACTGAIDPRIAELLLGRHGYTRKAEVNRTTHVVFDASGNGGDALPAGSPEAQARIDELYS